MKRMLKREEGQSLLIVAGALVLLVAFLALVVDAGNAYVQRRKVQNAMDAGSRAGALAWASDQNNAQVDGAIRKFVQGNEVDPNKIASYFVVQDGSGNSVTASDREIKDYGSADLQQKAYSGGVLYPIVGVTVKGTNITFNTYFAGVLGIRSMQVAGGSASFANKGACSGDGLFPIALSKNTFDENNDGTLDIDFEQDDSTQTYKIWDKRDLTQDQQNYRGNFGYLRWKSTDDASQTALAYNMMHPENSGVWHVNDDVPGNTGVSAGTAVEDALDWYISHGTAVTLPVFDTTAGSGNGLTFNIVGFARFVIVGYCMNGCEQGDKWIEGKFEKFVDPKATAGGCAYFGEKTVTTTTTPPEARALQGIVQVLKILPAVPPPPPAYVPVDVVEVFDISGSMDGSSGFGGNKLAAAKSALTSFNSNLRPAQGDQVGLVTFPRVVGASSYNYNCTQTGHTSSYYFGQVRNTLSNNISTVNSTINGLSANGGTPIGDAIRLGRQTVLGAGHQSGHAAVMIVASDGIANIRMTGKWTGYPGTTYNNSSCNNGAVQDAIDQANIAKGDSNADGLPDTIIFAIAIGNDFDPAAMQAIATPDTVPGKNHYFRATDAASMTSIYNQISTQVADIAHDGCAPTQEPAFASNATVTIRYPDSSNHTVNTTSTGQFLINNVSPGTYTFVGATVTINNITYNILTDGVGGPALDPQSITVDVGGGTGTYTQDLSLKTNYLPPCQ